MNFYAGINVGVYNFKRRHYTYNSACYDLSLIAWDEPIHYENFIEFYLDE